MPGKVPLGGARGAGNRAASTTGYGAFAGLHSPAGLIAESTAEITMRTPGTFSGFWVNITANNRGASTFNFRKNAANGNQTISVGASATGFFQDTSNSDTVAAADEICYQWNTGAGGTTFIDKTIGVYFEATTGLVSPLMAFDGVNISTVTTHFIPLSGNPVDSQTEADAEQTFMATGTLRYMCANISGNARSTTSTLKSRKNGADGNMAVSIGAGATGLFEDTSNSDSISDTDTACLALTLGTGTGNLGIRTFRTDFESSDARTHVLGRGAPSTLNASTTHYFILTSAKNQSGTETDARFPLPEAGARLSNLRIRVPTNGITASSTFTLRKNAAATALTISVGSGATGVFEDTTNAVVTGAAHDLYCVEAVIGGSGTNLTYSGHNILLGPPQSLALGNATATASAQDVTVTAGQTATLVEAVATASAQNVAVSLGALVVALTEAVATGAAQPVTVTLGGVTVTMTVAIGAATAVDVTATAGVTVTVTEAVATAVAQDVTGTFGALVVALGAALGAASAQDVGVTTGGVIVALLESVAAASAQDVTATVGGTLAALAAAVAAAGAQDVTATIGGVVVVPTAAVGGAVALTPTVVPGGISVQLEAASATATALDVTILTFALALDLVVRGTSGLAWRVISRSMTAWRVEADPR